MKFKCKICGREFDYDYVFGQRPCYCSEECKRKGHSRCTLASICRKKDAEKKVWAKQEATKLKELCLNNSIDELATYVYNNYEARRKANENL